MSDQSNVGPGEPITYMGLTAQDEHGATIGSVTDVVYDDLTEQPQWLVVNPGTLRADHFVPVQGAYTTADGNLVVAVTKQLVKEAPKATEDHVITREVEEELREYYTV
jgi:hypothetical protein